MNGDLSDIATALTQSVSADGQTIITGQLKFPNGTAAAPAFSFANDLTTGMYFVSSKKLGFSAGGTASLFIDQNNVGSGQSGNQLYFANGAILNPVGMIIDFAGAVPPTGWLACDGSAKPVVSYPELFQVLGTTWGTSAGNVVLPDLRGRATYGLDSGGSGRITVAGGNYDGTVLGNAGGAQNYVLLQANLPAIKPAITITDLGHQHAKGTANDSQVTGGTGIFANSGATNTATAFTGITAAFASNLGSSSAFSILSNAMSINKIIFAGRP